MAKTEMMLDITAKNEKALKSIEEVEEKVTQLGRRGQKSATGIKDKFDAVNGIIGGLLPRNMQTMIRRFQSTSRAVRRAGKSFSALRATLATLGIPALVMAIQLLIDNLETVTDFLGITSAEARLLAEEQEKVTQAVNRATAATEVYVAILNDANSSMMTQEGALKALSRQVTVLKDLNLEDAEAQEKVNAAIEQYNHLVEMRARQENIAERIKNKKEEIAVEQAIIDKGELSYSNSRKANKAKKEKAALDKELLALQEENQSVMEGILYVEEQVNETLEEQAEIKAAEAKAERERQAAATAAARATEQRLEREGAAVERLTKMREQANLDEKELAKDNLDRRMEAELAEVESEESKLAIKQYYANEWETWEKDFNDREAERVAQAQQRIDDALEKAYQERAKSDMSAREQAIMANEQYYDTLADEAQIAGIETDQLEEERLAKRNAINQKFDDEAAEKKQEAADKIEESLAKVDNEELSQREKNLMANEAHYKALLDLADQYGIDREALEAQRRERETQINAEADAKDVAATQATEKAKVMAKSKAAGEYSNLIGTMSSLAEEGSKEAKSLAIVEVLTQQAIAMATAVRAAVAAGSKPVTPATPFLVAANIVSMVGGVVSSFASIKRILDQAKGGGGSTGGIGGGGGGGRGGGTAPLVPDMNYDVENNAAQNMNVSAYVVQSQLQGSQLEYNQTLDTATL